jgi:hypothetical protein
LRERSGIEGSFTDFGGDFNDRKSGIFSIEKFYNVLMILDKKKDFLE